MTEKMLHMETEQNVHHVIATPHFYASESSINHFLNDRKQAMQRLEEKISCNLEMPKITLGAEVYYFSGMGRASLEDLCIQETDLLLLEMPFTQWTEEIYRNVKEIIDKQGLTLIMAHVERYYSYQKNKSIWNKIFALSVIAQFNAGCFLKFSKRKLALQFLKNNYPSLLGSDCHNISTRCPNLEDGRNVILKKMGEEKWKEMDSFGEKLLQNHHL